MASVLPAVGGLGTRSGRRPGPAAPAGRQQDPEVEHGVGVAGVGGLRYQVRAPSRSGGSSWSASRIPRLTMASVLPASAAFSYQAARAVQVRRLQPGRRAGCRG